MLRTATHPVSAISIYLMFRYIGVSFLAGLGIVAATSVFNFLIGKFQWRCQNAVMSAKDVRTKATNELFSQIKFVKVNAYEDAFVERVTVLRDRELRLLRSQFLVTSLSILSVWLSPMLILNATFALYVYLSNTLTAADTFTIISLFQILRDPLRSLPFCISSLIQVNVSLRRIQAYLTTQELMDDCIEYVDDAYNPYAVSIVDGSFVWGADADSKQDSSSNSKVRVEEVQEAPPFTLRTDIRIKEGAFVAIVGEYTPHIYH